MIGEIMHTAKIVVLNKIDQLPTVGRAEELVAVPISACCEVFDPV